MHRHTVQQALAAAEPPPRKVAVRSAPRLDTGAAVPASGDAAAAIARHATPTKRHR